MGRPRKNTTPVTKSEEKVTIVEESQESKPVSSTTNTKVNITETSNSIAGQPVKFLTGTQEQYERLKNNNFTKVTKTHVVQRGETLQSIASMYNVSTSKLIALNGSNEVSIGKTIYIG